MNHAERFVDSGYWIAFVNVRDALHTRARRLATTMRGPLVTTDAVLFEVADGLSGPATRVAAVTLLRRIRLQPNITVVPLTPDLYERGLDLYATRPDKEWGLTDCISFVVMQDRGIREALAHDQHFVQAGFRALLRE